MSMDIYVPAPSTLELEAREARRKRVASLTQNAVPDNGAVSPSRSKGVRGTDSHLWFEPKPLPVVIKVKAPQPTVAAPPKEAKEDDALPTPCVKVQDILVAVSKYYQVSINDLCSERRHAVIVLPRHVVCYLAKNLTTYSYPHIGRRLGDRDHTTPMHSVKRITRLLETDATLRSDIDNLIEQLGGLPQ